MTDPILRPYPRRTTSFSADDKLLDDLDSFVIMSGAESRSVVIREAVELYIALQTNVAEVLPMLVDAFIAASEAETDAPRDV